MATRRPLMSLKPSQEEIEAGIEKYFEENGGSADEPLLAAHIADPTPHSVYDDLPAGVFVAHFQNGLA